MTRALPFLFVLLSLPLTASTVVPFSPPEAISSAPLGASDPSIAASGNVALVVWSVMPQGRGSIVASLIDANGNARPPLAIYDSGRDAAGNLLPFSGAARAIGTNDGFLVVLYEVTTRARLLTRFIGRDGSLGEWHELTATTCDVPRLATNGARVLVMTGCDGASSFILDGRGNLLRQLDLGGGHEYTVTATDRDFVAFSTSFFYTPQESHTDLRMRRIGFDGTAGEWRTVATTDFVGEVAAAFDGTNVVLVWSERDGLHELTVTHETVVNRGLVVAQHGELLQLASEPGAVRLTYATSNGEWNAYSVALRAGEAAAPQPLGSGTVGAVATNTASGTRVAYMQVDAATQLAAVVTRIVDAPPSTNVTLSTAFASQRSPRVATDGRNRAAVWQELRDDGTHIVAGGLRADGSTIAPRDLGASSRAVYPTITRGAGSYLVTWQEPGGAGAGPLKGVRIDDDLRPLDAVPFVIAGEAFNPAEVAFDGTRWLAIWSNNSAILGARVSAYGAVEDPVPLTLVRGRSFRSYFSYDVAGRSGEFVIVYRHSDWSGGHSPTYSFIGTVSVHSDATTSAPRALTREASTGVFGTGGPTYGVPRVAANGERVLAVWPETGNDGTRVRGAFIEEERAASSSSRRRVVVPRSESLDLGPQPAYASPLLVLPASDGTFDVLVQTPALGPIVRTHVDANGIASTRAEIDAPADVELQDGVVVDGRLSLAIVARTSGEPFGITQRAFWLLP